MRRVWSLVAVAGSALCLAIACSTSSESAGSTSDVPAPAGNPYELAVKAPATTKVGVETTTEIVVTPGGGYKINLDYPAKLSIISVPEGAKVAAQTVTKADMSVEVARLVVPVRFTVEAPGEKAFAARLRFSVCTPQFCKMPEEMVTWTTTAEAAPQ
jgi:hypothetical protein